jgi:hypothetical protein
MPPPVHQTTPAATIVRVAFSLAVGLSAAVAAGPPRPAAPEPGRALAPGDGGVPASRPPLLGFAINAHHISDLSLYLAAVDAIAGIGANGLLVVSPMFQRHVDSNEIRFVAQRCPTNEQLVAILQRARSRSLRTTLMPVVLIEEPGANDWRGVIRPTEPETWWAGYDRLMDRFLDIARAGGADVLSVGSELNSTEHDVDHWRRVIDRARRRFGGTLTYTANWDRYQTVPFWPLVDVISVSAYFELAPQEPQASPERLAGAWRSHRDRLLAFARSQQRPVMLMEVGYPSLPWAAAHPWDYVPRGDVTADHDAQARCWRGFFDAWAPELGRSRSPAAGLHCYCWDPYRHGGTSDTGYGVEGKPALDVIRNAFTRIRQSDAPDGSRRGR